MTPFEAFHGYPPTLIKEYVVNNFKVPAVKDHLATFDEVLCILKNHLKQVRNRIKQQVDT